MSRNYGDIKIIGNLNSVFYSIDKVAPTNATVLIGGESGTGKEMVAKAIYNVSLRADKPLVVVNCGAMHESLLESTLYGHVKGAFTGAVNNRIGKFQQADGGTIFLDEIGEMSPTLQVKLLRVLQEGEYEPLGSENVNTTDVRVIAATNADLEKMIEEKKFREDLFYRLNVFPINTPPLRDRKEEDLYELTAHFVEKYMIKDIKNAKDKNIKVYFDKDALKEDGESINILVTSGFMSALKNYDWPGNIRELENAIEHAVILSNHNRIDIRDLKSNIREYSNVDINNSKSNKGETKPDSSYMYNGYTLKELEKEHILRTIKNNKYVIKAAAKQLGIDSTSTIYRKLKEWGMSDEKIERVEEINQFLQNKKLQ